MYRSRDSLTNGIKRATEVMIGGRSALVCGYGDVGKGFAFALRGVRACVLVTEIEPFRALEACMDGLQLVTTDDVVSDMRWALTAGKCKGVGDATTIGVLPRGNWP